MHNRILTQSQHQNNQKQAAAKEGGLLHPILLSEDDLRRIVARAWNSHRPDIAAYYLAALTARMNGGANG